MSFKLPKELRLRRPKDWEPATFVKGDKAICEDFEGRWFPSTIQTSSRGQYKHVWMYKVKDNADWFLQWKVKFSNSGSEGTSNI